MILGIGIDIVDIARFEHWHKFHKSKLQRIFSNAEVEYCLESSQISAQRFAARYAAREALYKALACYSNPPAFLTLCTAVSIEYVADRGAPQLHVDWSQLPKIAPVQALLSLSHSKDMATAIVLLQSSL